jgi:hypothetical protein
MDFVDEQHVVRFEVGQHRRQVAGALQHRPRGLAQIDAHLVGDDVRQRGLAQARRPEQQHMVHRFGAPLGGLDEDFELAADLLLADVIGQPLGPQRALQRVFLRSIPCPRRSGAPDSQYPGGSANLSVWMAMPRQFSRSARQEPISTAASAPRGCRRKRKGREPAPFIAASASRSL